MQASLGISKSFLTPLKKPSTDLWEASPRKSSEHCFFFFLIQKWEQLWWADSSAAEPRLTEATRKKTWVPREKVQEDSPQVLVCKLQISPEKLHRLEGHVQIFQEHPYQHLGAQGVKLKETRLRGRCRACDTPSVFTSTSFRSPCCIISFQSTPRFVNQRWL